MYDQSQYTSLWMIDKNGLWFGEKAYVDMKRIAGYAPSVWLIYTQNNPVSFWFGAYDQEALDKEAESGLKNFTDPEFLEKFEAAIKESYRMTKEISDVYFEKYYKREKEALERSPQEVAEFIARIHAMSVHTMSHYFITQPQEFYRFEEELKPYLPNPDLDLISTNGRHLTHISEIQKFIVDLAGLVKQSGKGVAEFVSQNKEWSEKIDGVASALGFLNWGLLGGDLADRAYVEKTVSELVGDEAKFAEEKEKMDILAGHTEKRNALVRSNGGKEFQLADIMGHASVMRFDLQTYMLCVINYADIFIKVAQEKYGLSKDQITSYFYDDIVSLIKDGTLVDLDIVEERQKGYLQIHSDSGVRAYTAEAAHSEIKDLLEFRLNEINTTKEVKGTIASRPDKEQEKLQARAFVLTTAFGADEELKKFKNGDILVATQTHPNLVPYMKSSMAIVTDEGGITCHAAIVSRELRKPCIIGTKLATKIFKTGDRLELDLKTGAVKKIA